MTLASQTFNNNNGQNESQEKLLLMAKVTAEHILLPENFLTGTGVVLSLMVCSRSITKRLLDAP